MKTLHARFVKCNQAPAKKINPIDAEHDVGGAVRRGFNSIFNNTAIVECRRNNGGMRVPHRISRCSVSLRLHRERAS